MSRELTVWMHGAPIGSLRLTQGGKGRSTALEFRYSPEHVAKTGPILSQSLPLVTGWQAGDAVTGFFSGLLPDELLRKRLAQKLGVSDKNPFALLEAVGRECAGAVALYPPDEQPPLPRDDLHEDLDNPRLADLLDALEGRPLLAGDEDEDGLRLSMAGAQDKLALGKAPDGRLRLLKGGQPTTHLLKTPIRDYPHSVANEFFCMRLARLAKLDVPDVEIGTVAGTEYFLVTRYDREIAKDGTITRLHQEDFCQSLGLLPEFKYQREGGPGIADCLALLDCTKSPARDRLFFMQRVIFNYLIGNMDAHGKNFALLYPRPNARPVLAPAYDLLCTSVWPGLSSNMAMKIGSTYKPDQVMWRHWASLVPDTPAEHNRLKLQLAQMSTRLPDLAETLASERAEKGRESPIFPDILAVISARCRHVQTMLEMA